MAVVIRVFTQPAGKLAVRKMATDDLKCAPNRILINTKGFDTVIKKGTIMHNPHITVMAKSTVTLVLLH